jgi:threonine/homoserine/homoserine lactone efflux protein
VGDAIGQVLAFGVVISLSPIPIIAIVLMLGTPRARANGPAFLLGWMVGLAAAGAVVLLVSSGADASEGGAPANWVGWLKLVLGALMLLIALRTWRGRPRAGDEAELPHWMETIDGFTPQRAAAIAVALSAINPKNLLLTVGAAAAIAQTGISTGDQAIALAIFVVIATLGPAIPVAIYFLMGERAMDLLGEVRAWMGAHNAAIMTAICLVIGAKLLGDGISVLSG